MALSCSATALKVAAKEALVGPEGNAFFLESLVRPMTLPLAFWLLGPWPALDLPVGLLMEPPGLPLRCQQSRARCPIFPHS